MAFFGKKFIKVTEKWVPVVKSVSNYDAKRLAKDIEKESTVSQTDVMAVSSWDNHCDALTAKGRNTAVCFYPFCVYHVSVFAYSSLGSSDSFSEFFFLSIM